MVQAIILFLFGVSASSLILSALGIFLLRVVRSRSFDTCCMDTYFNWIMKKGTEEERRAAVRLRRNRDLKALKALVGYGMLVEN